MLHCKPYVGLVLFFAQMYFALCFVVIINQSLPIDLQYSMRIDYIQSGYELSLIKYIKMCGLEVCLVLFSGICPRSIVVNYFHCSRQKCVYKLCRMPSFAL